jgi:hypothetical protein
MTISGGVALGAGVTVELLPRDAAVPEIDLAVDSLGLAAACARTVVWARGAADRVDVTLTVRVA